MIRVGILSFAHYHANFWSEAFRGDPRAAFIGVWDEDAKRGVEAAARFNVPFFADIDRLIEAVDAVAITSETARHRPLIEHAAARGKHVLCEKPIASSLAEADSIAEAISRSGVVFMQSFPKRFDPVNHEIRRLLADGALGKIWLVRVRHGHRHGLSEEFTGGWWTNPALSGGGTLIDEGVHAADFLRWLFGEPESVQAALSHTLGLPVEDAAIAVYRWSGGLVGEVATGWMFHAADSSIEIYGTEGSILLSGVDIASRDVAGNEGYLRVSTSRDSERRWMKSDTIPQFVRGQFHHQNAIAFIDCLTRGAPPPITLADGRAALAMILAAYEAARLGAAVQIADFDARSSNP